MALKMWSAIVFHTKQIHLKPTLNFIPRNPQRLLDVFIGWHLNPFRGNNHILVISNGNSRYPEAFVTESTTSKVLVKKFEESFAQLGYPKTSKTNSVPIFTSRKCFLLFLKIHSMQSWTRKWSTKRLKHTGNLMNSKFQFFYIFP